MTDTAPCPQCGTLVAVDAEFCPNCNFYMQWAKDPDDEESSAKSSRLPDEKEDTPTVPIPVQPVVEPQQRCPQCATLNPKSRALCQRCGYDFRKPAAAAPVAVSEPAGSKPPWLMVAVIGGAVVLVLVVAWALLLRGNGDDPVVASTGPQATTPTTNPPPTTIVEALNPDDVSAQASSSLPSSNSSTYGAENLLDGAIDTAWNHCGTGCEVSGDARQGVGETLTFRFAAEVNLVGFRIANGYQKQSESAGDVWVKNNRIRRVGFVTATGTGVAAIQDVRGFQTIGIDPVMTDFLIIEVTEVYEGDGTFNDLAVSEIEFLVARS